MNASLSRKIALGLIILAVLGTEISYHFTLETRFDAIEEKLQQDTTAMQQMQDSIDAMAASKTESISGLNRQLTTLQSTFEPLGKMSKNQADALEQLRAQIATLQQAQSGQQDAQKKLSDYIAQLETSVKKNRAEAEAAKTPVSAPVSVPIAPAPAPTTTLSAPTAQPIPAAAVPNASATDLIATPGAVAHPHELASDSPRAQVATPAAPAAVAGVTLRTDDNDTSHSRRALPVGASLPSGE
jgi:TolA-binding protein